MKVMLLGEWWTGSKSGSIGGSRQFSVSYAHALSRVPNLCILNPRREHAAAPRFRQLVAILRCMFLDRPDVVHVTTIGAHGIFAAILRPLLNYRLVWTAHSFYAIHHGMLGKRLWLKGWTQRLAEWLLARMADRRIVPSQMLMDEATAAGMLPRQAEVIPNGIDDDWLTEGPRQAPPRPMAKIFGHFLDVKGIKHIPAILASLPAGYRLEWIGHNEDDPVQKDAARNFKTLCDEERFSIMPPVPHAHVRDHLDDAAMVLVPSLVETFSFVVIEAAARGVPLCVAPGVALAQEVERSRAGLVVDFENADAQRNAYERILAHYEAFSTNALALARKYSWAQVAEKYVTVYESLLEGARQEDGERCRAQS